MTRKAYIELIRRQVYGSHPSDDATITINLVNRWLNFAIASAAKQNYKENIAIDGISYVNNSFYTTFKGIVPSKNENFLWQIALPHIPIGIGENKGCETLVFKDDDGNISYNVVWMTQNQRSYQRGMREIPNKVLAYQEGSYVYALSTILLSEYTASVTMVSGGVSTDLTSTINVPDDYFPMIVEFMKAQLMFERSVPVDVQNDGSDIIKST